MTSNDEHRQATATFDYSGSVVVVTGGSRGIGHGIASAFLAAGAEVVVCGRHRPPTPNCRQPPAVPDPSDGHTSSRPMCAGRRMRQRWSTRPSLASAGSMSW